MFCSIYKWKISQAMDSGKTISHTVHKHMQRCDSCREYAEFCTSLKPRFTQDKKSIFGDLDRALNEKILSSIPDVLRPAPEPGRRTSGQKFSLRRPALIPSFAAALTVLAAVIGILFLVLPRTEQTPALGQISAYVSAASPEEVLSRVESPLEKEYAELKRTFESTGRYLIQSFEFRLGQQAK